jgi:hypothetical protein
MQVQQLVAKRCEWESVDSLQRLDGFAESWERVLYRGVRLPVSHSHADTCDDKQVRKGNLPASCFQVFCNLPRLSCHLTRHLQRPALQTRPPSLPCAKCWCLRAGR